MLSVEPSVKGVARKTEVIGENLPQCGFVLQKSHMTWHGLEPWPSRWKPATNRLSYDTKLICHSSGENIPCFLLDSKVQCRQSTIGFHNALRIYWVAEQLLASQEVFNSKKLAIRNYPQEPILSLMLTPHSLTLVMLLGSVVVKALCYEPEGRGFDTRWGNFLNLLNPSGRTRPWGLLGL
jgi:hypothetical protein